MKPMPLLLWSGALAAAAGVLIWAFIPQPLAVEVVRVTRGAFQRTVDEDGKTQIRNRYVVSSPLAGTLERIVLEEGDRIESGAIVARVLPAVPAMLDARTQRELSARLDGTDAQLSVANAGVGRAEAALELARTEALRVSNLAAKGFASAAERDTAATVLRQRQKELEVAREQRHAASHAVDAARAALSLATAGGDSVKPWPVHAPVSGVVLRVSQESERGVVVGTPLLEIGDPADLEVVVDVLSADAVSIAPGARVLLEHWGADYPIAGHVRRVEPSAFTKVSALGVEEQRVRVLIDPATADARWLGIGDGYRVDARIVVDERQAVLTVPVSALFREGSQWTTFVIDGDRVRKRAVSIGGRGSQHALVDAGLVEGEQVVSYPSAALTEGTRVEARSGSD